MSSFSMRLFLLGASVALAARAVSALAQTTFDWDNYSGDSEWATRINWNPYPSPPATPGPLDTAIFDGQLAGGGVGHNGVHVAGGAAITELRVVDSAVVDFVIGDGTTASRFDVDRTSGNSLMIGDSAGDVATLNLQGGWLDAYDASLGGRAVFNVINPGSYWDARNVTVSGDGAANMPGLGLGLSARARLTQLDIGGDAGSGRVVVDGTTTGFNPPAELTVSTWLDIGPTSTASSHAGQLILQDGGRATVGDDLRVDGAVAAQSLVTVQSGGQLTVADLLDIGSYAALILNDAASKISTGRFTKSGVGGAIVWNAGTLEIATGQLVLDSVTPDSVFGQDLTIWAGRTLRVLGTSSPDHALRVGDNGAATLTITDGGVVECFHVTSGLTSGADGRIAVTGSHATLDVTEDLVIGRLDTAQGRLDISEGGRASAHSVYVGRADPASGIVTVDGAGSQLTSTGVVAIGGFLGDDGVTGESGGTGRLTVQNGGALEVAAATKVWGRGALELLGGAIATRTLTVVPGGTLRHDDGILTIDGGTFDPVDGNYAVNGRAAGQLPRLIVKNGGSAIVAPAAWPTGTLFVGYDRAGRLEIEANSSVQCYNGRVAYQPSGAGSALIDGANARWTCTTDLEVATGGSAQLTIANGGLVEDVDGAVAASPGSLAAVTVSASGRWRNADSLYVGGRYYAGGAGGIWVHSGGRVEVGQRLRVWHGGTVTNDLGGAVTVGAGAPNADEISVCSGGLLEGTGSLVGSVVNRGGAVAPGVPSQVFGTLYVTGAFAQLSGSLAFDVGGTTPGDTYDVLQVAGPAALSGTLATAVWSPYALQLGDRFTIITATGGVTGRFAYEATISDPLPGAGMYVDYEPFATSLVVTYHADFDLDGDVDGADLAVWKTGCGASGTALHEHGDADADHDVDGADLLVWQRQLGSQAPATSLAASVPEPAACVLAGLAVAALAARRRRRPRLPSVGRCAERAAVRPGGGNHDQTGLLTDARAVAGGGGRVHQ